MKKVLLLVLLGIAGLALGVGIAFLTKGGGTIPVPAEKIETISDIKPTEGKVVFLKNEEASGWIDAVWVYDFATKEQKEVIPGGAFLEGESCSTEECPTRNVAISVRGDKIAADYVRAANGRLGIGYIDLTSQNPDVIFLVEGTEPRFSPDGKLIAFNDGGFNHAKIKIFVLEAGTTFDVETVNSATREDKSGVFPAYRFIGWLSNDEILLHVVGQKGMLAKVSIKTGVIVPIIVPELSNRYIIDAIISPDGQKLLIQDEAELGVVNIDGSEYQNITPTKIEPWPGSGYYVSAWAPDSNSVFYIDGYAPKTATPGGTIYAKMTISDLKGTIANKIEHEIWPWHQKACWLNGGTGNTIVINLTDDRPTNSQEHGLAMIDLVTKQKEFIYSGQYSHSSYPFQCSR